MPGIHIGVGQHRTDPVSRMPIVRKAGQCKAERMRGERRYANAGQDQKTPVVHDPAEMRRPLARRPADVTVPCLLMPARGAEAEASQATVTRRNDPVQKPRSGLVPFALGVVRRHHRAPRLHVPWRNRFYPYVAEFLQPARQRDIGIRMEGMVVVRPRSRLRQDEAQAIGQSRQHFPRRRQTQLARGIAPVLDFAEPVRQRRAAALSRIDSFPHPRHRVRRKLM